MATEEKKASLRATYDAALKGEAFHTQEQEVLAKVRAVRNKSVAFGIGTACLATIVGLAFYGITMSRDHESSALQMLVGLFLPPGGGYGGAMLAWRMLRGNVIENALEEHRAKAPDPDGVKRTDEERRFLNSSFGVAQRLVDTVRNIQEQTKRDCDMAVAASGSTPDSASIGNALSRSYHDLNTLQFALEVDWQRNGIARPETLTHVATVTERVVAGMAACYPFVYRHVFVGRL